MHEGYVVSSPADLSTDKSANKSESLREKSIGIDELRSESLVMGLRQPAGCHVSEQCWKATGFFP